jgi:hypothetical protein
LGSESQDLPAFVVMVSQGTGNSQALADRQWGSGFLPTRYQGIKFRSGADPVLYLSNPPGYSSEARRRYLNDLSKLNQLSLNAYGDPEISTRIAQYEMAYRMQTSVPELTDLSKEPESTFELYGPDSRKPGSYAANCILARRLAERGVRFIQLFHRGWGGEFGRTVYSQGALTEVNYGRDHHPRCFSIWMAGGGVKSGLTHGERRLLV